MSWGYFSGAHPIHWMQVLTRLGDLLSQLKILACCLVLEEAELVSLSKLLCSLTLNEIMPPNPPKSQAGTVTTLQRRPCPVQLYQEDTKYHFRDFPCLWSEEDAASLECQDLGCLFSQDNGKYNFDDHASCISHLPNYIYTSTWTNRRA